LNKKIFFIYKKYSHCTSKKMATISSKDQEALNNAELVSIILPDGMVHLRRETARASKTLTDLMDDFGDAKVQLEYNTTPMSVIRSLFSFSNLIATNTPAVVPGQVPAEDEKDPKNVELADWEKKFFDDLTKNDTDLSGLFDFILAANYFSMELPLHRACLKVANLIKGKTPEQIRATFNIPAEVMARMGLVEGAK
jgi:S-phase kinase-associated protein 1